jgi:hypothetical protein
MQHRCQAITACIIHPKCMAWPKQEAKIALAGNVAVQMSCKYEYSKKL